MRPIRHLTAVAAAALLIAVATAPARADMEKAGMAMPAVAPIFASTWIAQDAGIFKEVGLDVTEQVIQGIGATNAVIAGSMDFANASGVTLTRAAARNQPIIGIANTYDRSGFWVVLNKKVATERHFDPTAPLAERAKILKGLRFAVGGIQTIPHAYLSAIAKAGGLDPQNDLIVSAIVPPETPGAMQTNSVDGGSVGPPVVEQVVQDQGAVIVANGTTANPVDPPWLAHIDANVILVKKQTCIDRKSLCVKMGEALVKAAAFIHDHPKETTEILGKRTRITDQKILDSMYKVTVESTPLAPVLDPKGLENADQLNVEAGFMPADQKLKAYDNIYTNEYVSGGK
ncbi:MAG TPA: ABC transporter substrate-binding protein [Stellaceae bacterium]|jgi:ABC-type nitrate/sulfonate/bicarbonate transport system substrate-binding protein